MARKNALLTLLTNYCNLIVAAVRSFLFLSILNYSVAGPSHHHHLFWLSSIPCKTMVIDVHPIQVYPHIHSIHASDQWFPTFFVLGPFIIFGGHGGHKVNFCYIPLPSSPLFSNSLGGLGSAVSYPSWVWSEPQPAAHLEHFRAKSDRF